jgi:hypothetical protein
MENKRGSSMATSTIVLLIIAVLILVVLIIGFTRGWDSFAPWLGNNNIDNVKNTCSIACSTNSQYGFCNKNVKVNDGENPKFEATCYELSINPSYSSYGVEPCEGLCS